MGAFYRIVRELATEDPSSFMEYLRMDEDHFNHLVSLVSPLINSNSQLKNFPLLQTKPSFYVKRTTGKN